MDRDEYIAFCQSLDNSIIDQPFEKDFQTYIARHKESRKWFAAIMEKDGKHFVNLKCDPIESGFLRDSFEGILPGYHMNKWHWNSVYLQWDVPDDIIKDLTLESYRLTE